MQTACLLFITKVVDGDEGLCLQDGGGGEQRDQLLPAHPAGAPGLAGLNSPPQRWASVARRAASPQFMKPFLLLNLVAFLHVFIFSWSCCHIFVPCISAPGSERWPGVGGLPCPGLLHALAPRPAPPAGRWPPVCRVVAPCAAAGERVLGGGVPGRIPLRPRILPLLHHVQGNWCWLGWCAY